MQDRLSQADALLHPFGECADPGVRPLCKADPLEDDGHLLCTLHGAHTGELTVQVEELRRAQEVVELELFRQEPDPSARSNVSDRPSEQRGSTASRVNVAEQHHDRRSLACSVRPQESENLSPRYLQA